MKPEKKNDRKIVVGRNYGLALVPILTVFEQLLCLGTIPLAFILPPIILHKRMV